MSLRPDVFDVTRRIGDNEVRANRFHTMPTLQSYRDLRVWQKAMDLAGECYALSRRLPVEERYVLSAQLRRSAISVPANLAEGYARNGRREYLQFISVAQGSLAELECQLELIQRLEFVTGAEMASAREDAQVVGRMLRRLARALRRESPRPSER